MKKLFVLILAFFVGYQLHAQKIGVKAGYGISGYVLNFDKPDGSKTGNGYHFGIVGELDMTGYGGRLDITYNQLGSDFFNEGEILGMPFTSDLKTDVTYIQGGVAGKKSFGPAYVFAGPYIGIVLSNETKGEITLSGVTETIELNNFENLDGSENDFYAKFDYGLYGGAGLNISGVMVEVFGGYGLMNFLNSESDVYRNYTDRAIEINDNGLDARDENFRYTDGSLAVEEPVQNNFFIGISLGYLLSF
jgi:hypothetical protein